jgi:hypothetical protein
MVSTCQMTLFFATISDVQSMARLGIKESVENDTGKMRIATRSINLLLRQSPFQHALSNFEKRVAIHHLK